MARKQERTGKAVQMELNLVPADYERLQAEVHRLRLENASLQSEVKQLKIRLQAQDGSRENETKSTLPPEPLKEAEADFERQGSDFNVTKQSELPDKIALFRSFFRGREDVYALRGVDKTGKAGYFRAREYLGKENGRAVWGEDLPLTDEVIAQHLQREQRPVTLGLYPLLTDDTCWFLAVDFDAVIRRSRRLWSVPAQEMEGMYGSFSRSRCRPKPPACWEAVCLHSPWSTGIRSDWIPTTVCFPIRTHFPKTKSSAI